MKIVGNCILFRSRNEFFKKELNGLKPNTIRSIDPNLDLSDIKHIRIEHTDTGDFFTRALTDISVIGSVLDRELVVFSWDQSKVVFI